MLLGAHVSIAGGIENAPINGKNIGCTAIQIFTKNQMQWQSAELSTENIKSFLAELQRTDIKCVLAHNSYLINLCSPKPDVLEKSRHLFSIEIERAEALGISYLVFHPGSHLNAGERIGILRIAENINEILNKKPNQTLNLLLENTAGQGSNIGYSFEQLAEIVSLIEKQNRVGVCFDTAHAFAAGYDFRDVRSYEQTFAEFDRIIGLEKLMAFHLNDSKKELGSRVDRHEHIGEGFIGTEAFRLLLNDPRFYNIPKILETPGKISDFKRNLNLLKSLIQNEKG